MKLKNILILLTISILMNPIFAESGTFVEQTTQSVNAMPETDQDKAAIFSASKCSRGEAFVFGRCRRVKAVYSG
jgi:hypothetical protein